MQYFPVSENVACGDMLSKLHLGRTIDGPGLGAKPPEPYPRKLGNFCDSKKIFLPHLVDISLVSELLEKTEFGRLETEEKL